MDFDIKNVFQPPISGINPQNFIENLSNTGIDLINVYHNKDDGSILMKKINKLNMNFYMLSEKYLKFKTDMQKINDNLFLNLFKQISIYIEEIEKLNLKIKENGNNEKLKKDNVIDLNKEVISCKIQIKNLESQLKEKTNNENKLNKEIESYKRQVTFYKDKLKLDLENQKKNSKSKFLLNKSCGKTTNNSSEKESISSLETINNNNNKNNNNNNNNDNNDNSIIHNIKVNNNNKTFSSQKILSDRISINKKQIPKYITSSNFSRREMLKNRMRNNRLKSNNVTFIDNINSINTSIFSLNENEDKMNKSTRLNSNSPKKKINIEKKKTHHNNHSVQINIGNINNNNLINNQNIENLFKEVNEDYDKNISDFNEQEEQIKELLTFIKGNKIINNDNIIKEDKKEKKKKKKNKTQQKFSNTKIKTDDKFKEKENVIYLKTSEI